LRIPSSLNTQIETRQAAKCFIKQPIENKYEEQGVSEINAAFLAGSLITGSETTSAATNSVMIYFSTYPQVHPKAFEELDSGCQVTVTQIRR
jgi:cytochrome P450